MNSFMFVFQSGEDVEFAAGGLPLSLLLMGALAFVVWSVLRSTGGNGRRPTSCRNITLGGIGALVVIVVGLIVLCGIASMFGFVPSVK